MGLLTAIAETRATKHILGHPQDPVLAHWFGGGDRTTSGESVTEDSALNYSAVWAATRLIAGSGGMLPLKMFKRVPGGGKEEARDRPEWRLVHDRPNPYMSSMMFRSSRLKFQVNCGNAFAEIERNGRGQIVNLWPIHSTRVELSYEGNQLKYSVKNNNGTRTPFEPEEILHVPSMISDDGICGKGVITHARESIGMGMATERHGAALFGNGARPGFVVKHPKVMSKDARQNFRREWNEIYQGPDNAHKMAILSEGADITPLGFSPEDSQFLATRQHNVEEIARWYGVPPHMIQHLLRATFNNIEHQSVEFVTYSLMPWLVLWEQELNNKLLSDEDRENYFFEHVVDGLLRGDAYTRAQALQIQAQNGALTIDEWRSTENRNPLPNDLGKLHFVPLNMQTVEQAKMQAEKPPEENDPMGDEPADDEEPPFDEQRSMPATTPALPPVFMDAHRSVMVQVFGRLLRKEAQAARRASNKPGEFLKWLDEFYAEHESFIATESVPCLRAVYCVVNPKRDVECEAKRLAAQRVKQARSELLEAAGVSPEKFVESVEQCVKHWEDSGAEQLADLEISYLTGG